MEEEEEEEVDELNWESRFLEHSETEKADFRER